MKDVSIMISIRPDGRPGRLSACGEKFNVAIFSDIIIMINVKLCMMVVLIELYPFVPLQ